MKVGSFPTPTERHEIAGAPLWVKREDLSGSLYGGNKVRRLETFFEHARKMKKSRVVTIGAVGSHHVLATTIYGGSEGFGVEAFLVAQPASDHARDNIRSALAHGLVAHATWPVFLPRARLVRDAFYIPLGGSSLEGTLAAASVAFELDQTYDWIVTALGSGGTAAGLAAGLARKALPTRVLAVTVAEPALIVGWNAHVLYHRAARAMGARANHDCLVVDGSHLGRGYGYRTDEGVAASRVAAAIGIALDPTYTEKAFAAALALQTREPNAKILYLHTCAKAPKLLDSAPLPREIEKLLRVPPLALRER